MRFMLRTALLASLLFAPLPAYNPPDTALDPIRNQGPVCLYPDSVKDRIFKLPFDSGVSAYMPRGAFNRPQSTDHKGYEFDFNLPQGAAVLASHSGVVTYISGQNGSAAGDVIQINHVERCTTSGAATYTDYYAHLALDTPVVKLYQKIAQGQIIGYVGPMVHVHLEVQMQGHIGVGAFKHNAWQNINSIPVPFVEVTQYPDGVPWAGRYYTSQNKRVVPVSAEQDAKSLPPFEALTARPNPFRSGTELRFQGPPPGTEASLRIFSARGVLVEDLTSELSRQAGNSVHWNGPLQACGLYIAVLQTGHRRYACPLIFAR